METSCPTHPSETFLLLVARDSHLAKLVKRIFEELEAIVSRNTYVLPLVNLDLGQDLSTEREIIHSTRKTSIEEPPKLLNRPIYGVSLNQAQQHLP